MNKNIIEEVIITKETYNETYNEEKKIFKETYNESSEWKVEKQISKVVANYSLER